MLKFKKTQKADKGFGGGSGSYAQYAAYMDGIKVANIQNNGSLWLAYDATTAVSAVPILLTFTLRELKEDLNKRFAEKGRKAL